MNAHTNYKTKTQNYKTKTQKYKTQNTYSGARMKESISHGRLARKLFFLFAVKSCLISCTATNNVLIVGDSMGEFMGKTLETLCPGTTVYNGAIGGTTADDWAEATDDIISSCSLTTYDSVYIAVGGNDALNSGCSIGISELANKIDEAVSNIVRNIVPSASTFFLTGYCVPPGPVDGGCTSPSAMAVLTASLSLLQKDGFSVQEDDGINISIVDSFSACGGSASSFSDAMYFQDEIHLNSKGYCSVFTQPSLQEILSCGPTSFDCDTLDLDLYGFDEMCDENEANVFACSPLIIPACLSLLHSIIG